MRAIMRAPLARPSQLATRQFGRTIEASPIPRTARITHPIPQCHRYRSSQPDRRQTGGEASDPCHPPDHAKLPKAEGDATKSLSVSSLLAQSEPADLVTPVNVPDDPLGVISKRHPAMSLLNNSAVVIQRQIEMMNLFLGFEQANRYVIMNGRGETIGYLAEQDHGIGRAMARQAFRTHRSFTAHVFDINEREVLRIHRPFSWISSRIRIYDPMTKIESNHGNQSSSSDLQTTSQRPTTPSTSSLPLSQMRIIGEAQQQWAPLRRKYNLFTYRPDEAPSNTNLSASEASVAEPAIESSMSQFAAINEPFLSYDFTLRGAHETPIGSVNRSFGGFAREIFTDTGVYALRMDSISSATTTDSVDGGGNQRGGAVVDLLPREQDGLTVDQRAVMLATAVSIDFDYFSRHSGTGVGGPGFLPLWIPGMGGGAAEAGAVGAAGAGAVEAGAAVGAAEVGGAAAAGALGRGALGTAAGGMEAGGAAGAAGVGTMAGYEAMQRGMGGQQQAQQPGAAAPAADDASPTNDQWFQQQERQANQDDEDVHRHTEGASTLDSHQGPGGSQEQQEDVWGSHDGADPFFKDGAEDAAGEGGEAAGGIIEWITDFFN